MLNCWQGQKCWRRWRAGNNPHLRSLVLQNGFASRRWTLETEALASRVPHLTRLLIGGSTFSLAHLNGLSSLAALQILWVKGDFHCWHCLMASHVTALRQLRNLTLKGPAIQRPCEHRDFLFRYHSLLHGGKVRAQGDHFHG